MSVSFQLAPGERLVTCPYDKNHLILSHRFGNHLLKCRRNYIKNMKDMNKRVEYEACYFNELHVMIPLELPHHYRNCPDRGRGPSCVRTAKEEQMMARNMAEQRKKQQTKDDEDDDFDYANAGELEEEEAKQDPNVEDWDAESKANPHICYNPRTALEATNYRYYNPIGITKAERRAFRRTMTEAAADRERDVVPTATASASAGSSVGGTIL